jgi:hypothetical protein
VALDWFEIEGPLNPVWPPVSHARLFGQLPLRPLPAGADVVAPRREKVRSIGGYLPSMYTNLTPAEREPKLETVWSESPVEDARRLLGDFLPRAFRRQVAPAEIEPYPAPADPPRRQGLLRGRHATRLCRGAHFA